MIRIDDVEQVIKLSERLMRLIGDDCDTSTEVVNHVYQALSALTCIKLALLRSYNEYPQQVSVSSTLGIRKRQTPG